MPDQEKKQAAVYAGWTTFKNVLDGFSRHIPTRIDRSVFPGQSGGVQAQLIAGLRFLGLIDEDGTPQPLLMRLTKADDEEAKKKVFTEILQRAYPALFKLDLEKTTPSLFAETMSNSYGVSGETKEKAIRFFFRAAKYSEIPVSDLLLKKSSNGSATRTARKKRAVSGRVGDAPDQPDKTPPETSEARTGALMVKAIPFSGGEGTLTLSTDANLLTLSKGNRDFLSGLLDALDAYEAKEVKP